MSAEAPAVTGAVRWLLRAEGAAATVLGVVLYARGDWTWSIFALLFLAPDLSFAGYLAGARIGAVCYNAVHSYVGPLLLLSGMFLAQPSLQGLQGWPAAAALIWLSHIGFDRALGYGLKYSTGFGATHLGRIGRQARDRNPR
jgi:hypothetical protein